MEGLWGAQPPPPRFCSYNNKTLIDWVSNESVGLQKQQSDPCFIVQTTPDILVRHVQTGSFSGLSHELLYSAGLTNFSYLFSVEVSLETMSPKRKMESFFTAASK